MDKETIDKIKVISATLSGFMIDNYSWLIDRAMKYWLLQNTQFDLILYQPKKHEYGNIQLGKTFLVFYYYNPKTKQEEHFDMDLYLLDDRQFELWCEERNKEKD